MNTPIVLILAPMVGSCVALTGKLIPRESTVSAILKALSIAPLLFAAYLLADAYIPLASGTVISDVLGGYRREVAITLVLDGRAWIMSTLIVLMTGIIAIASLARPHADTSYFFFLHMTSAGMQSVVLTGDIFTMFVSFEIVAIGVYVLIAWERTAQGLLASLKYLFLSSVGILFFLLGVFLIYRDLGTLSLAAINATIRLMPTRSLHLATAAICVGIGVRTAFIPFHTWLPEAHAWAPHPISALLSGVLIKVSFFAMIRMINVLNAQSLYPLLMWIGAITAFVAVIWALSQHDIKRLLAFHSISQMGYILAAWGAGNALSETAAYAHAIHHALFKALLFLAAGIAIERSGTRDLFEMRRTARGSPLLAASILIGALAISGIPPLNGYVSKQLISAAVYREPAYILLRMTSIGTIASFIKFSRIVWFRGRVAGRSESNPDTRRIAVSDGVALAVLALLVVAGGVLETPYIGRLATVVAAPGIETIGTMYTVDRILSTMVQLVLGLALAVVVLMPSARPIEDRIARIAPDLSAVLVLFVFGLVLFAAFSLLA
jgi:multicomponent Na+:H+ antiporter subunit D